MSLEVLSLHMWFSRDFSGGTTKVRSMEWLGGTMTPPVMKQAQMQWPEWLGSHAL